MKKITKKLELKKVAITKLQLSKVKGGGQTLMCNTTPAEEGGIGCHMF